MAHIFISHSSRDNEPAARLVSWLRANGMHEVFLDFDKHAGIAPGADWERKLYREVASAEAVILILTPNWFDSKWCFAEYTQARALGKAIFPLVETPTGDTFIAPDIQHLDLVKDREGGLERLAAELTRITMNARGGFDWDGSRPPFPGLLAFDESDAAIYFGRDDEIRKLIEKLNARRAQGGAKLVALLGASGSGKSSLLRAGLLPRLKRDKRNWILLPPFRPQLHPMDEFALAVATGLGRAGDWRAWRDALASANATAAFHDLARDLRAREGANEAQILISIDQAEELFGTADKDQAARFLRLLNTALGENLPFLAIMALRSDYLGQLQEAGELKAVFEEFSLKPMPIERVRNIIEGPARLAHIAIDDDLVTAATKDAATDDALPLLAFALRELYDRFAANGQLTLAEYRALGDDKAGLSPLENAVRRRAEDVLKEANPAPEELNALKEAFVPEMVRVNPAGEYVRRPASLGDLPAKARPLIERLAKARLLVVRREGDATIVEVAHEALLRKWPLLRGWLDEEREFLIGKDQLELDLQEWEKAAPADKNEALLSGLKLTRARAWLIQRPHQLSERERRFVQAGVAHHDAEAARRERFRRAVQIGTTAAALVLAVVAGVALWERGVAKSQQAEAQKNYVLALNQAAFSVPLLVNSYAEGAVSTKLMNQLVEESKKAVGGLSGETDDVTAARIQVFDAISVATLALGDSATAQSDAGSAIALATSLQARDPDNAQWKALWARSHARMSDALFWRGDFPGALREVNLAAGVTIPMAQDGKNLGDEALQQDVVDEDAKLGDIQRGLGNTGAAAKADQDWITVARRMMGLYPDEPKWQISLARGESDLGDTYQETGNSAAAGPQYDDCVAISAKLFGTLPQNAQNLSNLADCQLRAGDVRLAANDLKQAADAYNNALVNATQLSNRDPLNFEWREILEVAHQRIGDLLLQQKDYAGATREFTDYLTLAQATLAQKPDSNSLLYDVSNAYQKLGDALREKADAKDLQDSANEYASSLKIAFLLAGREHSIGTWHKQLATDYQRIGLVLLAQGDRDKAIAQFENCVKTPVSKLGWAPRMLWPKDVIGFCQDEIKEASGAKPR